MKLNVIPKEVAKFAIRIYQKTLSFDHAFWARPDVLRVCIFYPSCSTYTYEAIERFGVVKGGMMGISRIMRCNPLTKDRIDEVPDKFQLWPKKKTISKSE